MDSVTFRNRDQLLFKVAAGPDRTADFLDLGELSVFESKTVRRQRFLRILHEALPELRMLHGPPHHRTDHLVSHAHSSGDLDCDGRAVALDPGRAAEWPPHSRSDS